MGVTKKERLGVRAFFDKERLPMPRNGLEAIREAPITNRSNQRFDGFGIVPWW